MFDEQNTPPAPTAPLAAKPRPNTPFTRRLSKKLREAKRTRQLTSAQIVITPEDAQYLLDFHNRKNDDRNRPISEANVQKHVRILREGRWLVTHQGISFSREGLLNNGQHRLTACVRTGIPIEVYVVFGEDREAFKVIDTGEKRTAADVLGIRGHKNSSVVAAAARLKLVLDEGKGARGAFTPERIDEVVEADPLLVPSASTAERFRAHLRTTKSAACLAFFHIQKNTKHPDKFENFVERLIDGANLDSKDPILLARNQLLGPQLKQNFRDSRDRSIAQSAVIIKAWNLHVKNRTTRGIAFSKGQKYPVPV